MDRLSGMWGRAARPGALGPSCLGRLGVQFTRQMGFDTVAIARGSEAPAEELGAIQVSPCQGCGRSSSKFPWSRPQPPSA
jgi:hypothetical protein